VFDTGLVLGEAVERLQAEAAQCVATAVWSAASAELVDALRAVVAVQARLGAVTAGLVHELAGRGVHRADQSASMVSWLRDVLRVDASAAKKLLVLADTLHARPVLADAVGSGAVSPEQAVVIGAAVAAIAAGAGAQVLGQAEKVLIAEAEVFEPVVLRGLGSRILHHLDPGLAERVDADALARQDSRARAGRRLSMSTVGDGSTRLVGLLPDEAAATLRAALCPLAKPVPGDERSAAQRNADALTELAGRALRGGALPASGGELPQIVVTVGFDVLRRAVGAGTLDTGQRLSPTQVRRIACDAAVIPAVLGTSGQVLDLGASRRLFTGPLRRALNLRDRGCAFPGCDRPPAWCQAHHIRSWLDGGPTALTNGVVLCPYHHRSVHHHGWTVAIAADNRPEFTPPPHIDPHQHPRRNHYHQRE
jgi:hypothetical protein